jgi:uncharacterized protein YciI
MKTIRFAAFLLCLLVLQPVRGAEPRSDKPKQFIYVLHLVPRLHDDKAWTEQDKAAVERHFNRFKTAVESGEVILVGRTEEPGEKTFGIAIFQAADETAARLFMNEDPAVAGGQMTAELHPFRIALERKNP